MIFIQVLWGRPVKIRDSYPNEFEIEEGCWQDRRDWTSFEEVTKLARYATAMTGISYIPTDSGGSTFPRYDVIAMPKVGDKVSYSFNGDSYPDGVIVLVSRKKFAVTTSNNNTYCRRKLTGAWIKKGGTWSLIPGHVQETNPEF